MVGKFIFVLISLASCHGVLVPTALYLDEHCGRTINIEQYVQFRLRLTRNVEYQNDLKCEVTLETFPGWKMMFFFQKLSTEKNNNCTYDWVELHDGNSRDDAYIAGKRHCGNIPPSGVYNTSGQYMTVYFQSDESVQKHGFDIILTPYYRGDCSWTEHRCNNNRCIPETLRCNGHNPCGDFSDCDTLPSVEPSIQPRNESNRTSEYQITTTYMDKWCGNFQNLGNSQIRLQLTSSPVYAKNISCQLHLRVNETQRMLFFFEDMDIEQSSSCEYDYLEMVDGLSTTYDYYIGGMKHCGQIAPSGVFTTSGRYLTLYFHSDKSRQFRGFDMIITSFHTVQCISPGYLCNNGRCIPRVLTCSGHNPCGDYSDCPVPPTTPLTTPSVDPNIPTVFFLDNHCGTTLYVEAYGQLRLKLTSDPSYQANLQCKVLLETNPGNYMLIAFIDLDTEDDCNNDWLELDDGAYRSNTYIAGGKQCGTSPPTGVYKTSGNHLTVYFESDSSVNGTGFDLSIQPSGIKYMDGLCGKTISIEDINQIRLKLTNNYNYLPNFRCQVTIKTDYNSRMMFYLRDLETEKTGYTCNDWLEIDDGSFRTDPYLVGGKQCGLDAPSGVYRSSGRYMTLYFQSDSTIQYSGFDLIITSFHRGSCRYDEYQCGNGRCISVTLKCNGLNPCGDYSDCTAATTKRTPRTYTDSYSPSYYYHSLSVGAIVGIVVGSILMLTFLTVVISVICSRRTSSRTQNRREPQVATINSSDFATYGYTNPMAVNYSDPPPSYTSVLASAATNQGTTSIAAVNKQYNIQ